MITQVIHNIRDYNSLEMLNLLDTSRDIIFCPYHNLYIFKFRYFPMYLINWLGILLFLDIGFSLHFIDEETTGILSFD